MIGLTPDITRVTAVRHGVLALTFADGTSGELAPVTLYSRIKSGVWPDHGVAA